MTEKEIRRRIRSDRMWSRVYFIAGVLLPVALLISFLITRDTLPGLGIPHFVFGELIILWFARSCSNNAKKWEAKLDDLKTNISPSP